MSGIEDSVVDVEWGRQIRRQSGGGGGRRERMFIVGGSEASTDGSRYLSDTEFEHQSLQSSWGGSLVGGTLDECRFPEIENGVLRRRAEIGMEMMVVEEVVPEYGVDLESGEQEMRMQMELEMRMRMRMHVRKKKRDCRICHLRLIRNGEDGEERIELGCNCRGGLGACHRSCAETWFSIKGDTICEICGAIAANVYIEQQPMAMEEANMNFMPEEEEAAAAVVIPPPPPVANLDASSSSSSDAQTVWSGSKVMNVILSCVILAFVISWFFHNTGMQSKT